jgi:hypothetical protein
MRASIWPAAVALLGVSLCLAQKDNRPPGLTQNDSWRSQGLDPSQVEGTINTLNQQTKTRYGKSLIVNYHLDLGPLNRVQLNPDLWKNLSSRQRRDLGNKFAKAFRGTGLLFAQFLVGDVCVGKVRSDPIRGGLKYEPAE